jgi:hypothetical protein
MTVSVGSFRRASFFAYVLTDLIKEHCQISAPQRIGVAGLELGGIFLRHFFAQVLVKSAKSCIIKTEGHLPVAVSPLTVKKDDRKCGA